MCGPYWSFVSTQTPRRRRDGTGRSWKPWISTVACRLCLLLFLVKWISWYFCGAKTAPCWAAHLRHLACAASSLWQFSSVVFPKVRILVSSTKPSAVVGPSSSIGRNVEANRRERMGDKVEPWGIPVSCGLSWSLYSPSLRHVVLSCRKD